LSQTRYLIFLSFPFHLFHKLVQNYLLNKAFYIFLFILLFRSEAKTQTNLVYNGDFEIYDTCPNTTSYPGNYQIEHCLGWYAPTYATSDYYNSCASSIVGVPANNFGFQYPYSGNAYCGLYIQNCTQPSCNGWWVEYIQTKLINPLNNGTRYTFSFKIVGSDYGFDYYFWKLGAYFTKSKITSTTAKPFVNITPQVLNQKNNYLTDTLNWFEIKGSFIAQGQEEYLTIGYFPDTLNLDTLREYNVANDISNFGNYYFIDDLKLYEEECVENFPNVFTPNNDSVNDILYFKTCSKIIKTTIYNRWGNLVFETDKQNRSWDGRTTSGEPCVEGNYFYIIETEEKTHKGFIQLIR